MTAKFPYAHRGTAHLAAAIIVATQGLSCMEPTRIAPPRPSQFTKPIPGARARDSTICEAGTRRCSQGAVWQCTADGRGWGVAQTCLEGSYCEPATTSCSPGLCAPAKPACLGSRAGTCDATGRGLEAGAVDCLSTGQFCIDGGCVDQRCPRAEFHCVAGNVHRCSDDGSQTELIERCDAPDSYCIAGEHRCRPSACLPGTPVCHANHATTCDALGSGPVRGGIDCQAEHQVCYKGACRPKLCDPATPTFCDDDAQYLCTGNGSQRRRLRTCTLIETCDPEAGGCVFVRCPAGQPACDHALAKTCNAQGTEYEASQYNCEDNDEFCHQGECTSHRFEFRFDRPLLDDGWRNNPYRAHQPKVGPDFAAAGSKGGLHMPSGTDSHGGISSPFPGILYGFPNVVRRAQQNPGELRSVHWWARPHQTDRSSCYLRLGGSAIWPEVEPFVYTFFNPLGYIHAMDGQTPGVQLIEYEPGRWYELEVRFNWEETTMDHYVDGELVYERAKIPTPYRQSPSWLTLYNFHAGATCDFDEITIEVGDPRPVDDTVRTRSSGPAPRLDRGSSWNPLLVDPRSSPSQVPD